jgi:hypothetical protein
VRRRVGAARKGPAMATGIVAMLAVAAGAAFAAMSGGGTISVCVHHSGGGLYRANKCARHDKKLSWNVQGPRGAQGVTGPPGPTTGPAGGALTGAYPNPGLAPGAVGTAQFGTIPAARVTNSNDEAVANGLPTTLTFDTNAYDNDSIHSTTTNPSRLTAPLRGIYEVTGQVEWSTDSSGYIGAQIGKDGTEQVGADVRVPAPSGISSFEQVTAQVQLNVGDYVELVVQQSSGATLTAFKSGTWLAMHWVGP